MICPYCGKEIDIPWKEHFFPKSIANNDWDFVACNSCNHVKRGRIVYPFEWLFEKYPAELSFNKFERLWKMSAFDKYLCIVPADALKTAFTEGCWRGTTSKIFSIEERIFYGLDKLQEMYLWATKLINEDPFVHALVMSYSTTCLYLLHTYPTHKNTKYKEILAVNAYEYSDAQMKGILIAGSANNKLWKYTSSYVKYFEDLMNAPSYFDMVGGKRKNDSV